MKLFADDDFTGIPLFVGTPIEMRDKLAHFLAGATLMMLLLAISRWTGIQLSNVLMVSILLAIFIGWEILELVRFWLNKWQYGVATDYLSWRDIIADIAGAAIAFVLVKM